MQRVAPKQPPPTPASSSPSLAVPTRRNLTNLTQLDAILSYLPSTSPSMRRDNRLVERGEGGLNGGFWTSSAPW